MAKRRNDFFFIASWRRLAGAFVGELRCLQLFRFGQCGRAGSGAGQPRSSLSEAMHCCPALGEAAERSSRADMHSQRQYRCSVGVLHQWIKMDCAK